MSQKSQPTLLRWFTKSPAANKTTTEPDTKNQTKENVNKNVTPVKCKESPKAKEGANNNRIAPKRLLESPGLSSASEETSPELKTPSRKRPNTGAAAGSDLSFGFTSAATGGETATPSSSGGYAGASGSGGGYTRGLNVKAQLSIERLPFETSIETIRNIFGRYGRVARVVCDYRIAEERLNVWLDYEDEKSCENAVRENGRKMERNTIVVQKSSSGEGGFGGSRGPKKDAWGNISRGPKGDRGESRGDTSSSGLATSSDTTATSGDWASADWGASTSTTDNNSGFDSSFDNEDRRSSRGRGGGRGGRDRGGRGGGRGRGGGGGGGRFQPYDKSDDYGEKSALPAWDDIVAGKSSTSTATPKADWGGSGDADSGNKDSVPFSQQPTQPLNIDWD